MLPIAAKHVARWPMDEQSTMLDLVRRPLMKVQEFLDLNAPCVQDEDTRSASKLPLLRAYATRMETLLPRVTARGVDIPEATIVSQVGRYLDLIEAKILLDQTRGVDLKTG
jgi:hypothetical protein